MECGHRFVKPVVVEDFFPSVEITKSHKENYTKDIVTLSNRVSGVVCLREETMNKTRRKEITHQAPMINKLGHSMTLASLNVHCYCLAWFSFFQGMLVSFRNLYPVKRQKVYPVKIHTHTTYTHNIHTHTHILHTHTHTTYTHTHPHTHTHTHTQTL